MTTSIAILGASGSGKTTLLRALRVAGLPFSVDVWMQSGVGYTPAGMPTARVQRLGRIEQAVVMLDFFPDVTVELDGSAGVVVCIVRRGTEPFVSYLRAPWEGAATDWDARFAGAIFALCPELRRG